MSPGGLYSKEYLKGIPVGLIATTFICNAFGTRRGRSHDLKNVQKVFQPEDFHFRLNRTRLPSIEGFRFRMLTTDTEKAHDLGALASGKPIPNYVSRL
jgi:hypothetical protein